MRAPSSGRSSRQAAVWTTSPVNESSPSMSGMRGSDSRPTARTNARQVISPSDVMIVHRAAAGFQVASSSSQPRRSRSSNPSSMTVRSRYSRISAPLG
ncbi:Uncharacterised protein [Mycobacteroides abscessus subsp. abscessus]|nr:Uncharacterised protein [Mycobacteroides abscessus subsp. abscessus]